MVFEPVVFESRSLVLRIVQASQLNPQASERDRSKKVLQVRRNPSERSNALGLNDGGRFVVNDQQGVAI